MAAVMGERAVVLGAGMAGLLAAGTLRELFAEVVVIDRDALDDGVSGRRGVPQDRHAHVLLAGGQQVLDAVFPGLAAEVVAGGAPSGDVPADVRMYLGGHRIRPTRSGLPVVMASRPFLEGHLRARVRQLPDVRLVPRCDVVGLTGSADGRRVTGVRLLRRADHSAEEELPADVVIDATGRTSRAPAWLAVLGHDAPPEDRWVVDVAYATRRYRLPPGVLGDDIAVLNGPTPDRPRAGVLHLMEGGLAMVTLAGVLGDRPPLDPSGFTSFARSLRFPDIHDAIAGGEPLDDPVPFRFPASVWRRYERLRTLPDGFAPIGDAVCSLNPIYGQGMTAAALQVAALGRHLQHHRRLRARVLQRDLARLLAAPWAMAAGADSTLPGIEVRHRPGDRVVGRYMARLQAAAAVDDEVARAFVRVSAMVDPPPALFRPAIARRVLRRRRAEDPPAAPPGPGPGLACRRGVGGARCPAR